MFKYILLLLFNVFIGSTSQAMLKKAATCDYKNKIEEYINPWVISAYFLFGVTTLINVIVYSKVPLSLGMAVDSVSYIFVMIYGTFCFKERLNIRKILAIIMIVAGVMIYAIPS